MYSDNFNQNLYINNKIVSGVRSLNTSYQTNTNLIYNIDGTGVIDMVSSPIIGELRVDIFGNPDDPFINFTGNNLFSGSIQYGDRYLLFSSGTVNRYGMRYDYGSPISVTVDSTIYGEMAEITGNYTPYKNLGDLNIYDFHSIDVNFNNLFIANDVRSFELSIVSDRNQIYEIGKFLPTDIQLVYPILLGFNFSFVLDEFRFDDIRKNIKNLEYNHLDINLRKFKNREIVRNFNFKNFILNNQSVSLDSTEEGIADLAFVAIILSGAN